MFSSLIKQGILLLLAISLVTGPVIQSAHAGVIDTQTAIDFDERADRIAHINTMLAREDVRSALIEMGVAPDDATARIEMMTDSELQMLEAQLDELPAGGTSLIGVLGIVAIVLVILELLDVTDLFTAF